MNWISDVCALTRFSILSDSFSTDTNMAHFVTNWNGFAQNSAHVRRKCCAHTLRYFYILDDWAVSMMVGLFLKSNVTSSDLMGEEGKVVFQWICIIFLLLKNVCCHFLTLAVILTYCAYTRGCAPRSAAIARALTHRNQDTFYLLAKNVLIY